MNLRKEESLLMHIRLFLPFNEKMEGYLDLYFHMNVRK